MKLSSHLKTVGLQGFIGFWLLVMGAVDLSAFQKKEQQSDSTESFFYIDQKEKRPFRPKFRKPEYKGMLSIFRYLPDENSESSINFELGLEVEWNVEKRLYASIGLRVFFVNQNFPVGEEVVRGRLASGALLAREHVSTDISMVGFEIPITIRYKVGDKPGSLFISGGLSSRTSLKEKYTDHIDWKTGGTVGGGFLANSIRSTTLSNESDQSFEFFNLFHAATLGIGKGIHVYGEKRGEIMVTYTFNVTDLKNIFQEARYKKFETLGLTVLFPLPIR